ncbi:MAG: hydrogenase maturation nickel metallochaperone HypA [Polyangiaceae bacterium]
MRLYYGLQLESTGPSAIHATTIRPTGPRDRMMRPTAADALLEPESNVFGPSAQPRGRPSILDCAPIDRMREYCAMHEYSLVLSLIERAEQEAQVRGAKSIAKLALRVGQFSGVEPDLLAQAFEIARTGTACARATLVIALEPGQWTCPTCSTPLEPDVSLRCSQCDTAGRLTSGGELYLEQMEIEV